MLTPHSQFQYTLKRSSRARRARITVKSDGSCVVTMPSSMSTAVVDSFLAKNAKWLIEKINYFKSLPPMPVWKKAGNKRDCGKYKDQALALVETRLAHFNAVYGHSWKNITIRNQKGRWGSCSKQGNLNFNYKIVMLPPHMADYIIVHELCHLKEFNHSKNFWNLVAKTIPNHKEIRKQLKSR